MSQPPGQPPNEPPSQPPYQPAYQPPYQPGGFQQPPPTHSKATLSLILGLLGITLCGPFTGIPAIITGRQATKEIDASAGELGGSGLATAGLVLGIVGTLLGLLALVFVVLIFGFAWLVSSTVEQTCSDISSDGSSSTACLQ